MGLTSTRIEAWLREDDPRRLEELWREADAERRRVVGPAVHLRGLIEFSNHCVRLCRYCGIAFGRKGIPRYRMNEDEICFAARSAAALGCGTVVLQSGEDPGTSRGFVSSLVRRIKAETGLAVTLSLGERSTGDLAAWRSAGADRYLLRFETSNRLLFRRIHPEARGSINDRIAMLRILRDLGYEVGSGVMVGIPGQTVSDLVQDIQLFEQLGLDMIGIGPYLAHPETHLGQEADAIRAITRDQAPGDTTTVLKMVALARLAVPWANIPATTAIATLDPDSGRESALRAGANVVMPIFTPSAHRASYEIYPGKACTAEGPETCVPCLRLRILSLGRTIGEGPGGSLRPFQPSTHHGEPRRGGSDEDDPSGWSAWSSGVAAAAGADSTGGWTDGRESEEAGMAGGDYALQGTSSPGGRHERR